MEPDRNNALVHRKVIQKQCCCCYNVTRLPENQSPWHFASNFMKFSVPLSITIKCSGTKFGWRLNPTKGFQLVPKQ